MRLGEEMIAKTVCRHAVKANDPLRYPEVEKLIRIYSSAICLTAARTGGLP
jgi:hypothetical protein